MNCRKCGAELHPEQKVCIQCGERTAAGGKFDVDEDHGWRPSPQQIRIGVGVIAALLLALILYKALHVTPPEVVAKKWFDLMLARQFNAAQKYVTPAFEQNLQTRMMDMRALADTWVEDISGGRATCQVGPPTYDTPTNPRGALVVITIKYPGGEVVREVRLQMVKVGRAWKIDQAL